jgi:hypothetical protein
VKRLPPGTRPGENKNAILGGYRLWANARRLRPARRPAQSPLRSADPVAAAPLPS